MAFNDIYRLRVYGQYFSVQVVNVMHFVQDDPLPTRGALELATDFVNNFKTLLCARVHAGMLYQYVEVQKIVPYEGGPVTVSFGSANGGVLSGACISVTLAEVVTIYSERPGKRGRGRLFLPPPNTATTGGDAGSWSAAQTARTTNLTNALTARYIGSSHPIGWLLGVWSKASGPADPPWSTDQFAKATALVVRSTIRTQRRRQLGVGR